MGAQVAKKQAKVAFNRLSDSAREKPGHGPKPLLSVRDHPTPPGPLAKIRKAGDESKVLQKKKRGTREMFFRRTGKGGGTPHFFFFFPQP